jgi:protein-disulfide isomerase
MSLSIKTSFLLLSTVCFSTVIASQVTDLPAKPTEAFNKKEENQPIAISAPSTPTADLEKAIVKLFEEKPEIIIKAIGAYTEKQQAEQQKKVNEQLVAKKSELLDKSTATILGNPEATTKLIVFVDPNCPHCRGFEEAISQVIKDKSLGDVCVYLRQWSILGEPSEETAKGLIAASKQGKFEEISKVVSSSRERLDGNKITEIAEKQGLDLKKFKEDMASEQTKKILEKNDELAQALGLQGTPSTIVSMKGELKLVNLTDRDGLVALLKEANNSSKTIGGTNTKS